MLDTLVDFLLVQFTAFIFAFPTAALLWFATNKYLAIWGPENAFLGSLGFWLILAIFSFTSLFFPNYFATLLGKVWQGIIFVGKWL